MEWKPIETAPKDGEYLCLGHRGMPLIGHYKGGVWWRQSFSKRIVGLTRWMPLPDPPRQRACDTLPA